jgi:hypothetical protein
LGLFLIAEIDKCRGFDRVECKPLTVGIFPTESEVRTSMEIKSWYDISSTFAKHWGQAFLIVCHKKSYPLSFILGLFQTSVGEKRDIRLEPDLPLLEQEAQLHLDDEQTAYIIEGNLVTSSQSRPIILTLRFQGLELISPYGRVQFFIGDSAVEEAITKGYIHWESYYKLLFAPLKDRKKLYYLRDFPLADEVKAVYKYCREQHETSKDKTTLKKELETFLTPLRLFRGGAQEMGLIESRAVSEFANGIERIHALGEKLLQQYEKYFQEGVRLEKNK